MFDLKNIISKFGHYFKWTGYLAKLMRIFSEQLTELKQTIDTVEDWRDIDKAEGRTLDHIGENVKQPRGKATDPVYRILLKSKIARNLSDGTIDTIIQVLSTALSVPPSEIRLQEKWFDEHEPEPAAIKVIELPLAKLNEAGLDPSNFVRIVKRTVAGGVSVGTVELTGTFEFGDISNSIDTTKGLGDINDDALGGYLGAVYTPSGDIELPI
ncbi:hypothetical protein [Lysinibacillus sp. 54212]|uniref:hypothetical protein n=1 Tax=Lysinibacillus sp. 54212 TaxID=3119829 RepID=UPI002FCA0893